MRRFAAFTLSGLLTATALVGCKNESSSGANTDSGKDKPLALQTAEFEQTPAQTMNLPRGQRCYFELCNDTIKQVPNIILTIKKAATPSAAQEAYYQQYIEPVLTKYSQAVQHRNQTLLKVLEEKESRFATTTLNQAQLRLVSLIKSLNDLKNTPNLYTYWITNYAKLEFAQAFSSFQQFGKFSYFQRLYPNKDLAEAYLQELTKINSTIPRLEKDIGIKATSITTSLEEKIKNRKTLDIDEVEELSALSNAVRMIAHYLYEDGTKVLDTVVAARSANNSSLYDDYKKSFSMEALRKKASATQALPKECKDRFYQSINLYPQQAEITKFQELAENARKAALSQLTQQDPAYNRIQSLKFVLPSSAEDNTKSYLRSLNSKYNDSVQDIERFNSMSDASALTFALFNAASSDNDLECAQTPSADISDKTVPADGFLLVSWFSVRYPQVGLSILSHEIGHTAFAYSNSINITRQCLMEKQGNTEKYLNEDYADLFAAKNNVALMSQFNFKPLNFGCSLVFSSDNTNLINMDADDPHATGLYRAIQLTIHSGQQLPESCQEMLQGGLENVGRECH